MLGQAATTIVAEVLASDGIETGGLLVGPDRQAGELLITHATGPGPHAEQGPASFRRDTAWCQAQLDLWRERMLVDWVGDWHLHPIGHPDPSHLDVTSAHRIVTDPELGLRRFVVIIAQVRSEHHVDVSAHAVTRDAVYSLGRGALAHDVDPTAAIELHYPPAAHERASVRG